MAEPTDSIRLATADDQQWLAELWNRNRKILGNLSGGTAFWRWLKSGAPNEFWYVIPDVAFMFCRKRRDGMMVVYDIVVDEAHQRNGYGRALMAFVGRPVTLKTDEDNERSNAFYRSLGLTLMGHTFTKAGKKMNVYQGW